MNRILMVILAVACLLAAAVPGWALGTPAGTLIRNTATATYDVGTVTNLSATASTGFLVAELANVDVVLAAAGTVAVMGTLPIYDQRLYFSVTNNGNGTEDYAMTVDSSISGDQFDPANPRIFIDAGAIGAWEGTGVEVAYAGPYSLPADGTIYVWVLNDVLDTTLADGDAGQSELTATSTAAMGNTAPGTVIAGAGDDLGDGPGDLVLGPGGGTSSGTGAYVITQVSLVMTKSIAAIVDTVSATGDQPIPGARVTYLLSVQVNGTGTADNVVVRDPIPTDTTYEAGSLSVNGVGEDDDFLPGGADNSGFDGGNGWIEVTLGSVNGGAPAQTISFSVTIDN